MIDWNAAEWVMLRCAAPGVGADIDASARAGSLGRDGCVSTGRAGRPVNMARTGVIGVRLTHSQISGENNAIRTAAVNGKAFWSGASPHEGL